MALITLVDKLTTTLENGEFTVGVLLDFSNAFDTINHQIFNYTWNVNTLGTQPLGYMA